EHQNPTEWVPERLKNDVRLEELLPVIRTYSGPDLRTFLSSYFEGRRRMEPSVPGLRVIELILARNDLDSQTKQHIAQRLNRGYPAASWEVNRELSRILLHVGASNAVSKTIRLLERAPTQEQQLHYIEQLRNVREGWTTEDRKVFFEWFLKSRDPKAHAPEL